MKRSREPEVDLDTDSSGGLADSNGAIHADVDLRPVAKIAELDTAVADEEAGPPIMKCTLPPHKDPLLFKSYPEYEAHYSSFHTNRCLECRKNFPSDHLLGLHIEEWHDPLVVVRRDRGEHTYSCFVEGCERKCLTYQKRRMHLIDKHMYPKNFFFAITKEGVDGRRSLLVEDGHRRRRSSAAAQTKESRRRASPTEGGNGEKMDASTNAADSPANNSPAKKKAELREVGLSTDADMADLTGAMSALHFVPPSVRFGRGRAGFAKR
ncbi:Zinc finger protein [Paramyrothecium foliicola]|nr:Zinc finger protein [Paramyrothecium foliicola]